MEQRSCVWCGGSLSPVRTVDGWLIGRCRSCDHHQVASALPDSHTDSVYADSYFTEGGAGYVDYLAEERLLRRRGRRYGRLIATWRRPGTALDVGSAAGFIPAGLRDAGWRPTGVEPNAAMATVARSRFGLPVVIGGLDQIDLSSVTPPGGFDAITLIQVIAHLPDPAAALRSLVERLAPGGVLLVETWDRSSRAARLFGERWHEWSPPSVVHWFTADELSSWGSASGLTEVGRGHLPKWISVEHGLSLAGVPVPGFAGRVTRRLAVPYPGDDLVWIAFRRPS
jgi:SAM-dependent methyltransferase